jgi:hypothetical protein
LVYNTAATGQDVVLEGNTKGVVTQDNMTVTDMAPRVKEMVGYGDETVTSKWNGIGTTAFEDATATRWGWWRQRVITATGFW